MTAPPSWPPSNPETARGQPPPAGEPERPAFRGVLGAAQPGAPAAFAPAGPFGQPGLQVNPATITQQFALGPVTLAVQLASGSAEQLAETAQQRLRRRRRGYKFGPVYPAQVAGYPGVARVIESKTRGRQPGTPPVVQMYTVLGPYGVMVTVSGAAAQASPGLAAMGLYPAAPPVISPVVRLPGTDPLSVEEKLTIPHGDVKLTAIVSRGQVTSSTDEFAMRVLSVLRSRIADLAVDNWQPDVFLGGHACVRDTFLRGGVRGAPVRSEFWWAGVVNGRGIQLFVSGTKSIIGLQEALPFRDVVVLLPPN
jgi:hypothetical protein